jgi:transposase
MAKQIKLTVDQVKELRTYLDKKRGSAKELAKAQAIFMYEKRVDAELIVEITGLKKSAIFKWRARFIRKGIDALKDKEKKSREILTKGQIRETLKVLSKQSPRDFGYDANFWTVSILAHRIKEQYNVQYKTKKPLYLLFKRAKFSFHKPGQHYRNRNQQEIDEWTKKTTPIIEQYLQDPETVVLTGDEMILSTQTTFQKIWLPINSFPKIDVSNKRMNRSVYGFLNVKNGVEHAYKTAWQNSTVTCKVLDHLCQLYKGKKIVLLWDNAPWHRSKEVRQWLENTKHDIFLIAFPRYAPELNPQEHVWKKGRAIITHNKFIEHIDKTTKKFVDYLNNETFDYALLGLVHA